MQATKSKLEGKEKELLDALHQKMALIQAEIDGAMIGYNEAKQRVTEEKAKVKPLREKLAPYGEMIAAVAAPKSRDKYFPNMTKSQFLEYVEFKLNG